MLHRKQKNCCKFMAKSLNGQVVKSLYIKIATMWTRPKGYDFYTDPHTLPRLLSLVITSVIRVNHKIDVS